MRRHPGKPLRRGHAGGGTNGWNARILSPTALRQPQAADGFSVPLELFSLLELSPDFAELSFADGAEEVPLDVLVPLLPDRP